MDKIAHLKEKILAVTGSIPHSRTHILKTFNSRVKRDDELGFGISGSKLRKYTSLLPYIIKNNFKEVVLIGSSQSNHVLGLSQLLIENGIKPLPYLLGSPTPKPKGNLLLLQLLVPESSCRFFSQKEWSQVEAIAAEQKAFVVPEGGCMEEALPGALTLALDVIQNEAEDQIEFSHVFIDAGTGLSAIATILAFAWLGKKTLLHVLLLAEEESAFLARLKRFQLYFEQFMGAPVIPTQYRLYRPKHAKSFGSVNKAVIDHIKFLAREEGFFTDPIYSAKLFWEAKKIIEEERLSGNILVIHSGGALTLMGFTEQLA